MAESALSRFLSTLLLSVLFQGAEAYYNRSGYYIGSSIGGLLFFAFMVGVCFCCMRRRRLNNQQYIQTGQPGGGVTVVNTATGQPMYMNQPVANAAYPGYPSYPGYPTQPQPPPPYMNNVGTGNPNAGYMGGNTGNPNAGYMGGNTGNPNAGYMGGNNAGYLSNQTAAAPSTTGGIDFNNASAPPPSYDEVSKGQF